MRSLRSDCIIRSGIAVALALLPCQLSGSAGEAEGPEAWHAAAPGLPACLPAAKLLETHGIRNIEIRHVKGDPRSQAKMSALIDVSQYKAAIVLMGGREQRMLGMGSAARALLFSGKGAPVQRRRSSLPHRCSPH